MLNDKYPKLVRDFIPQIIQKTTGKLPNIRILGDNEFNDHLIKKLIEEVEEFKLATSIENKKEEMADILEVIDTILDQENWSANEMKDLQAKKRNKRGGFKGRVLLLDNN